MRLIFAGTPPFAASALSALLQAGHHIALVLTQPDRAAGRGLRLQASAVKQLAQSAGLPIAQPPSLKDPSVITELGALEADVMIVAAYGLLLPQAVLDVPRLGCLNIHASLLPRWRGAAPIQRALLAGDRETGISIMQMDAGLDSGAMLLQRALAITASDTTLSLHEKLADLGAATMVQALALLAAGSLTPRAQDSSGVTYAAKISKEEARLDWQQNAQTLSRAVRAYNLYPGAYTTLDGATLKVWAATPAAGVGLPGEILVSDPSGLLVACGSGALRITEIQRAGAKRLSAAQFLAGASLDAGLRLI